MKIEGFIPVVSQQIVFEGEEAEELFELLKKIAQVKTKDMTTTWFKELGMEFSKFAVQAIDGDNENEKLLGWVGN